MAPPNNPAVAKLTLVGNRDTREWVNTFHVHKTSGSMNGTDLHLLCLAFKAWWDASYKVCFPPAISLDVIQARKLDPSNPLSEDFTTGLPDIGTNANTAMEAANVTETMSWRTGLAGRKYRGRDYVPAIAEAYASQDDRATSPFVALLTTAATQYLASVLGVSGMEPVVFHAFDNSVTPIVSFVIEAILDSQRRRLPARGR